MSAFKSNATAPPVVEFKGQLQTIVMRKFHSKINVIYEQELTPALDVYHSVVTLYTEGDKKVCYRFPPAIYSGFPSNSFKLACEQKAAAIAISNLEQAVSENPSAFVIPEDLSSSSVSTSDVDGTAPSIVRKDWKGLLINLLHIKYKGSTVIYPFTMNGFPAQFVSTVTIRIPDGRRIEIQGITALKKQISEKSAAEQAFRLLEEDSLFDKLVPTDRTSEVVVMDESARSSISTTRNGAAGLPKDWKGDLLNILQKKHKGSSVQYTYVEELIDGNSPQFTSTVTIITPQGFQRQITGIPALKKQFSEKSAAEKACKRLESDTLFDEFQNNGFISTQDPVHITGNPQSPIGCRTYVGVKNPVGIDKSDIGSTICTDNSGDVVQTVLCTSCLMELGPIEDFHFYSKTDTACEFALNRDIMDKYIAKADDISDERHRFVMEVPENKSDTKKEFLTMTLHCISCLNKKNHDISSENDEREISLDNTEQDSYTGSELTGSAKKRQRIEKERKQEKNESLEDLNRNGEEKIIQTKSITKVGGLVEDADKNDLCVFGYEKLSFLTSDGEIIKVKSWSKTRLSPLFRDVSKIRVSVKL